MEDDSNLIKGFFNLVACAIVGIGYFERPAETDFWYYAQVAFLAVAASVVGVTLAAWDERRTQRRRDKRAGKLLKRLQQNPARVRTSYFVYLRPFFTTGNLPVERRRGGWRAAIPLLPGYFEDRVDTAAVELEQSVAKALAAKGLLIGLGRPGEQIGAGRIATDDATWQKDVRTLVQYAQLIVLIPSQRPGTLWEVRLLRDENYLDKCVLVMPPKLHFSSIDMEAVWEATRTDLAREGISLPVYSTLGMLFTLKQNGKVDKTQPLPLNCEATFRKHVNKLIEARRRKMAA